MVIASIPFSDETFDGYRRPAPRPGYMLGYLAKGKFKPSPSTTASKVLVQGAVAHVKIHRQHHLPRRGHVA